MLLCKIKNIEVLSCDNSHCTIRVTAVNGTSDMVYISTLGNTFEAVLSDRDSSAYKLDSDFVSNIAIKTSGALAGARVKLQSNGAVILTEHKITDDVYITELGLNNGDEIKYGLFLGNFKVIVLSSLYSNIKVDVLPNEVYGEQQLHYVKMSRVRH